LLIPGADNVPAETESSAVARTSVEVTTQSRVVTRGLDDGPEESDRTLRADTATVGTTVSGDALSREKVSSDAVSSDAVSRDAVSRDAVSGDEVNRDAVSRDEVNRDTVSGDGVSREDLDEDFLQLPELRPPNIMPRGNVGTSTQESNPSRAVSGAASVMVREILKNLN
jgi:pentapeptide MXKDX repeat protein